MLELYDTISEGPGGDILRVIGGGGPIGLQNLYMRRRVEKDRWRRLRHGGNLEIFPTYSVLDENGEPKRTSASDLVRKSLRRNIPDLRPKNKAFGLPAQESDRPNEAPKMSFGARQVSWQSPAIPKWNGLRRISSHNARFSFLI